MRTLEVGDYKWKTYREFYDVALRTGSALRRFLNPGDVLCIYANSCEQWQAAAYGAFSHSITVATSYANLGEEALVYSLEQVRAHTAPPRHRVPFPFTPPLPCPSSHRLKPKSSCARR